MNKGIIVVDVVESCDMCKMGFQNECYDRFECFLEPYKKLENPEECRPDWCPIQPIPKEKYEDEDEEYEADLYRAEGWNDCIREILEGSRNK